MFRALGLDVVVVLESTAAIYRGKGSQPIVVMKASMLNKGDLEDEPLEGANLYAAATKVQTIGHSPAIGRSFVTLGVVMVDNT